MVDGWARYAARHGLGMALCPHAVHVTWNVRDTPSLQRERPLWIRSSLPSLKLDLRMMTAPREHKSSSELPFALQAVAGPSIVELRVDGVEKWTRALKTACTEIIRQCPALETVRLSYASAACVNALAALPSLRQLNISRISELVAQADAAGFLALQTLEVFWTRHDRVVCLLRRLGGAQSLTDISLSYRPPSSNTVHSAQQVGLLCQPVVQHCNVTELSHLCVTDEGTWGHSSVKDRPFFAVQYDHIRCLHELKKLKKLHIIPWGCVDLTDTEMQALSASWPLLENLYLGRPSFINPADMPFATRATAQSLLLVASHCPNLYTFEMTLNLGSGVPISRGCPGAALRHMSLQDLYLGDSVWGKDDTRPLALMLTDVFPSLQMLTAGAECAEESGKVPYRLLQKLKKLVYFGIEARRQERMHFAQ
ncbi:hypothetical protein BD626DRAFT_480886 [Schizophyllum amplum]|uniref:F-box domain-containing protein n=1 Tax=Schizophyllum amplum TaxID=97359 RepID=A0A550CTL9_9AGAR|nr:hypothetical protein BD626DRAFT_480886 [Auriculariopsis ampla]